jgi:hypothetical protein
LCPYEEAPLAIFSRSAFAGDGNSEAGSGTVGTDCELSWLCNIVAGEIVPMRGLHPDDDDDDDDVTENESTAMTSIAKIKETRQQKNALLFLLVQKQQENMLAFWTFFKGRRDGGGISFLVGTTSLLAAVRISIKCFLVMDMLLFNLGVL